MAYIGKQPVVGNFQVCDAISVVNGQAAYTLQVGGTNVEPESANHMLVSLNGILQKPGSSFTISGSTMTFASNLATGDVIDFVQILGNVLDIGQPSDDTVTAAKLNNDIISGQTALTSSPDDTDELLISDAGTIKRIDVSLVCGKNTPYFRARLSSNQNTTNGTATKVQFDTEEFDTGNEYDNSSNYRFTPANGNTYCIIANVGMEGSGSTTVQEARVKLYKNGSEVFENRTDPYNNSNNKINVGLQTFVTGNGSDYYEIYASIYVGSGTPRARSYSYFSAFKLIS